MNDPETTSTTDAGSDPLNRASRFMTELTDLADMDDFGSSLTAQLRKLTGAERVILMAHHPDPDESRMLSESGDGASIFTDDELAALCPACTPHQIPPLCRDLEAGHPVKRILQEKKIESIIRLPLQSGRQLNGSLILLNLPEEEVEPLETLLNHLKPFFSIGLRNTRSNETILRQNEQLEIEVEKRTAELEKINLELSNSRLAALNMMEDAIQAQGKMDFQNKLFSSFMDTLPALVFFKDTEGRVVSANKAYEELCGTSQENLVGKTAAELFRKQDADVIRSLDLQVMESKQTVAREEFVHNRWWFATKAPRYDEAGRVAGIYGISWDITDRKQADQALQDSEKTRREWLAKSPVCTKILDLDFNLRFMSEAGVQALQVEDVTELYGKPYPFDFFPDSFNGPMQEALQKAKDTGETGYHEGWVAGPDGKDICFSVSIHPVKDDSGQLDYMMVISSDVTERKEIEAKMAELARFPEENTNPVLRIDRDGILLYANRSALTFLAEPDRQIGKPVSPRWNKFIRNAIKWARSREIELPYDGRVFSITLSPVPERDYVNIYARDITDRVEAQKKQEAAQRLLRSIIDTIPSRVWWKDADSKYLGVNLQHAHDLGLANPDELIGKTPYDLFHKDIADLYVAGDREVFESGQPKFGIQEPLNLPDGTIRWLETNKVPLRDKDGTIIGTVGAAEDITERRKQDIELRRLSTTIEQTPEAVVITDTDGTIQYVNPAFETTSGYSREEAIGQNPRILRSEKQDEAFYENLWATLAAGKIWEGHFINQHKDGSLYTEEATVSPVRDADGNITNYVAVKRDITQELQREEELRQSQKMEAVGQLAGGVAHDFNNILQAILGFSEILMLRLDKESTEHRNVVEIHKSARRATDLTQQLLAFSRKQPAEIHPIELNDVVYDAEGLLEILLGSGFDIKLQLEEELDPILGDQGQITQIIMNLMVNARDAMPDGGQVTVGTENITFAEEDIEGIIGARAGRFVCLSVSDTGSGMSDEVKERLFDPFFTTKEVGKGTGLGLSVVYGIIRQSKGWINVYSEKGHGTTFRIYLPVSKPTDQASTDGTQRMAEMHGVDILLVEDDPEICSMVVSILETVGHRPTARASAEEALRLFEEDEDRFDLLFSDVVLPEMDGIELADQIRKKKPALPVLIYSGFQDQRDRWKTLEQKGYHFTQKPFTVSALISAVQDSLNKPQT